MNLDKLKTNRLPEVIALALLFILGVFYMFQYTSYLFFYQEKGSLFLLSFSYLIDHMNQPGGFLVYLSQFQTTFYFYPLVGAVLVSLVTVGIVYTINRIGIKLTNSRHYFLPFLIGASLFLMQIHYEYKAFNNIGILIQLLLFYLVLCCFNGKKSWITVVLFPINYFLFGSFSVIFLFMLSIHFIQNKEWQKFTVIWLVGIVFIFIGKEFLFYQTNKTLLSYPFESKKIGEQTIQFVSTVLLIAILPILFQMRLSRLSNVSVKKIKVVQLVPFLVIGILAVLAVPKIDKKNSDFFHVEKLLYQRKFKEIIAFNLRFPSNNMLTTFSTNIALVETGRLTESFFQFRQSPDGGTLFLKWNIVGAILRRGGQFYYSIGMINEAQRWAYEYMVMSGLTPETLKVLIKTELINGNYKMAEKYIAILNQSLFYKDFANESESLLFNDNAIKKHPEYGIKQALIPNNDFFVLSDDPLNNLDLILKADSTNIPAIEYKLAWLMLQKDMKGVVEMLPVLEKAGYSRLPKNVEELVVSYKLLKVGELPHSNRLKINPQTEKRFDQFFRIFQQYQNNKQQAQRALAKNFSDTYWYYVFFN